MITLLMGIVDLFLRIEDRLEQRRKKKIADGEQELADEFK